MDNNNINGTIKLSLHTLKNVEVQTLKGKRCVCIPADENGIFLSDKGGIYISFFINKLKDQKWGYTHSLKRKMSIDEYKNSTKEDRDNMPICGYFEPYKPKEGTNTQPTYQSPREGGYQANTQAQTQAPAKSSGAGVDDLPF